MAPIRRYLRISKYTVLECRIYLENPSDTRWLLDTRDPVLPRIFAAIRPLVLPKLREENERLFTRKKGRPVKDVMAEEDFEVSLFLRESRTRHSLLTQHKNFEAAENTLAQTRPTAGADRHADTGILIESDSESEIHMAAIPQAGADAEEEDNALGKDTRASNHQDNTFDNQRTKRKKGESPSQSLEEDDKKMRFKTNYEGFNIYGWMLCLLVTRTGGKENAKTAPSEPTRQVLMEEWISTQAQGTLDEE
ncbi:hypothetical protein ARAM_007012 [Aspergillus rambellii]|uniref:Uncharacterized protein n=1 Tax=Aspergillus rambellii TaxID=308745 RepID=A0A0F8UG01_9EURO|nr:hypothetical protein ARAM_007012 [Aspergillus rambellii]